MNNDSVVDVKKTAINLNKILSNSPNDYYYIKGFINCLVQKNLDNQENLKHKVTP